MKKNTLKTILWWTIAGLLIGSVYIGSSTWLANSDLGSKHPTCLDLYIKYHSDWNRIQKLYTNDPTFFAYLDNDSDDIACENFQKI